MTSRADVLSRYCADLGWYLVAIPAGSKAPKQSGWQRPETAITTAEAAREYWTKNPEHNAGLLHSASGTAAWDVDNVEHTRIICREMGIDYDAIMASAPRIVGRRDRGKILFRVPAGLTLDTKKISWPVEGDPRKTEVVFELRAGSVQDVLPPSVHPDTGNPYTWAGPSIYDGLPDIPAPLLTLWTQWDRFRGQLQDCCPWRPAPSFRPPTKIRPQGERTSVIDSFNAAHDMGDLLVQFGYKRVGRDRFLSPNSTSGLAGVILFEDGRAYSHHASDPFDSAHTFDAFDLWCQYQHGGDVSKAVRDAGAFLHIDNSIPDHDPEAIEHGRNVAAQIMGKGKSKSPENPMSGIPEHLLSVPGRLQDFVNHYNTTAAKPQPQFAVQAALAFGSVVMGRRWVTDQRNYSSLFFINVGKSASGKEHAKTVVEEMLEAAGLSNLIGPSGYTSASGVISALLDQPNHLTVIDELGRVLASTQASGNHNKADAQTVIMEIFGRMHGTLRPQGYSKMGVNKQQSKDMGRTVQRPALTILSMTTPETLFETLTSMSVKDGFLGRFIAVETQIGRQVSKPMKFIPPSEGLIEWAKEHASAKDGNLDADSADVPPSPVIVPFGPGCQEMIAECEKGMVARQDQMDKYGLEAMFGRTKEIAMKLSLIIARSCGEDEVSTDSLRWAIDYVTFYADRVVDRLRKSLSDGPFDAACKAVMKAVEDSGLRGVTEREISRSCRVFGNMEPRRRKEVMEALVADRGIAIHKQETAGRPRMAWVLPPDEIETIH